MNGGLVAASPNLELVSVVPKAPTTREASGKVIAELWVTLLLSTAVPTVVAKIGSEQAIGFSRQVFLYTEPTQAALTDGLNVNPNDGPPVSAEPTSCQ